MSDQTSTDRPGGLGRAVRAARLRAGLSQRELARRLSLSSGMISQLEKGHTQPSVTTLLAVSRVLDVSLDSLFSEEPASEAVFTAGTPAELEELPSGGSHLQVFGADDASAFTPPIATTPAGIDELIARQGGRRIIKMASGVTWELLTPDQSHPVLFMMVTYPPGSTTNADGEFVRHTDLEYFYLLEGTLEVYIEFEHATINTGDSMWFESTRPHNFVNNSDSDARGVWCLLPIGAPGP